MEVLPDIYYLESIEQLRALADDLRQQIVDLIEAEPMTVTQIGAALDLAPAKIHYHVRELERVGLVRLVQTRERGGILEKYYRARARSFLVSNDLLQRVGPDDLVAAGNDLVQSIAQSFVGAFALAVRADPRQAGQQDARQAGQQDARQPGAQDPARVDGEPPPRRRYALTSRHVWLTADEFEQIVRQVNELLKPFEARRACPDERRYTAVQMLYETAGAAAAAEEQTAATAAPTTRPAGGHGVWVDLDDQAAAPPSSAPRGNTHPRRARTVAIGVFHYSREDLERVLQAGGALDLIILGVCSFDDDVSADLVDLAIARFRHRGALHASPAVRAVLQRKMHSATP